MLWAGNLMVILLLIVVSACKKQFPFLVYFFN